MSEATPPTRRTRKETQDPALFVDPAGSSSVPGPSVPGSSESAAPRAESEQDESARLATAQLEMAAFGEHVIPYVPPAVPIAPSVAPWALGLSILALVAALFTGWLVLLGVVAVVLSIVSLRRPGDGRRPAVWALSLAVLSVVFSVGWLIWGFSQLAVV